MVVGACPHVLIFANEAPDESKMSGDRFLTRQLNDEIYIFGYDL